MINYFPVKETNDKKHDSGNFFQNSSYNDLHYGNTRTNTSNISNMN